MVSFKIWLLGIMLFFALLAIAPWGYFQKGVEIKSVLRNSAEFEAGLRAGMLIQEINGRAIITTEDYAAVVNSFFVTNNSEPIKIVIKANNANYVFLKNTTLDITVGEIPKSRIKTGLDLSGGARALIKAENHSLSEDELNDLIAITNERFNIYGLKDITIRSVKDLEGNNYMLLEIAGATPSDLEDLISSQGNFEGKIGNKTVFVGGVDIAHVERSQGAGIEACYPQQTGEVCKFIFRISLTEEAAQKQAEATANLGLSTENPEYLSEKLDLYVDNVLKDSLLISKDLKGRAITQISISGSGTGTTHKEAVNDALEQMKKLQTILITGSLPYKLEIVKLDTISPTLGKEFTRNLVILALSVFAIISVLLFIKYKKIKITSAVILTMFSEAFITLGIAALIKWNLDAPSIAGIIAGMGTGVNDQIVVIDETGREKTSSIKERIKRAFFIIMGAFFTIIAAMLPLFWAGAGMLKGFALTTLIGVSVGILITRPAFAEILKLIEKN